MKKASTPEEVTGPSQGHSSKIANVLNHLLTIGDLNRFEAERIGDHCLNTTISVLANNYGLMIIRTPEKVKNRFGSKTRVYRYSLPNSEHERAAKLLQVLTKRGH